MTSILIVLAGDTAHRRLCGGVNVRCPECARIAARDEGQLAPWCGWCAAWLCSARCARRHACPARRAVHALLDRLVAA